MASKTIWPNNVAIDVVGATGPYGSGKTLFACSIDPARTRLYDFEKSAGSYVGLGIDRVDVPDIMLEKFPKGYAPRQVFEWWYSDIKLIEPGKYTVIAGDPVSDIEDGLVEWVKSRHKEWGFKTADAFYSTGGIFWSKVKSEWKRVLADLSSRCETFAFTTHLKFIWKHGKPTTAQTPKGKSTLMELSSLFLFLDRPSDQLVPSATVLKSRLASTSIDKDGTIKVVPALPPRIVECTPKRIREYIVTPPDYDALKEGEREEDRKLSDAERLEMEAQIAGDKRAAEEAALKAAETHATIQSAREAAMARLRPTEKKEAPAKVEGGGAKDAPKEEKDTKADKPLIEKIIETGRLVEAAKAVYRKLNDGRAGVDLSKFKGADCLDDYLQYLTKEELANFKTWLQI